MGQIIYFIRYIIGAILLLGIGYFIFKKTIYRLFLLIWLIRAEKRTFQQMMLSPTDETVSNYIKVLKRGADYISKSISSQNMTVGEQMKYINAYNIIKNTGTVSEELKEELYRVLLVVGISVSK